MLPRSILAYALALLALAPLAVATGVVTHSDSEPYTGPFAAFEFWSFQGDHQAGLRAYDSVTGNSITVMGCEDRIQDGVCDPLLEAIAVGCGSTAVTVTAPKYKVLAYVLPGAHASLGGCARSVPVSGTMTATFSRPI